MGALLGFLSFIAVIAILALGTAQLGHSICDNRWGDSKFEHRWGWLEGCMIKPEGAWVPADNYRVL